MNKNTFKFTFVNNMLIIKKIKIPFTSVSSGNKGVENRALTKLT